FVRGLKEIHNGTYKSLKNETSDREIAPIRFCIYSHEAFDKFETKEDFESIRDGLDNIKIYEYKNFIGSVLMEELQRSLKSLSGPNGQERYYVFSDYMSYQDNLTNYNDRYAEQLRPNYTAFLFQDRSIDSEGFPGPDHYYVCYLQVLKNENPFYKFE